VLVGILVGGSYATADELPSPLRLEDVLDRIRRHNPELTEQRALANAAAARPRAVSQLDDPTLSLEWWQQPINFATVPIMVSVRQPLPWPGKLRARNRAAQREADTARDAITDTERRLEAEAKRTFFDLAFAERSLVVNDRERVLLEAMVQSTEVKYRVGKAPQAAMLKTQSELLTVENERLDLDRVREEARARLNALLDRPAAAQLPATALPPSGVAVPSEADLVQLALDHRPELRLARDAIAEESAKLDAARRESNPELAVWAGYMVNIRGVDTFTTGVSTTLPIFSTRRRNASASAAESELQAKKASLDAARRKTEADVRIALLQMQAAARHAKLHADKLIPLAELSLQSAQAAYQNDRIDFYSVLDAARMVRDHHLNHERYLVEYEKRLADLELAIGQDLPREVSP
jgi:outer membrane protein TolC